MAFKLKMCFLQANELTDFLFKRCFAFKHASQDDKIFHSYKRKPKKYTSKSFPWVFQQPTRVTTATKGLESERIRTRNYYITNCPYQCYNA